MFILNRQQVKFCKVVSSQAEQEQVSPAIAFNGSLFIKGETFLSSEKSKACKRVQEMLEVPQQLVILLEDTAEIALYHLNPKVRLVEFQEESSSRDEENPSTTVSSENQGMFGKLRRKLNQSFQLTL